MWELRQKAEKLSDIEKHYLPKGLEEKLTADFGYRGPYAAGDWGIYTKPDVVGSRFVAFYREGDGSLVVEGSHGPILGPVKDDLKVICDVSGKPFIARALLSDSFAFPWKVYASVASAVLVTLASQATLGPGSIQSWIFGDLQTFLIGETTLATAYAGLSCILYSFAKKTCSELSIYFKDYTIGKGALENIAE